jgi:RNA polymerase sigma factor (sigma-70 family)
MMPTSVQTIDREKTLSNKESLFQRINEILEALKIGVQVMVAKTGLAVGKDAIDDTADDILQASMEVAVNIADRYDPTKNAYSWLMAIAVNKIKEARRLQAIEYQRERLIGDTYEKDIEEDAKNSGLSEDEWLETLLGKKQDQSRLDEIMPGVEDILALIKEPERSLLRLFYINEMSAKEIAQVLNVNEATTLVRLSRARKQLFVAYQKNELRGAK